ncbi:DMT family transporter [Thermithiobacillus plumbiphilus]|uniref:EamA family transporter n=1 Tax=Thermithiobacillus plumbiphilus TaxID=1729899 RepID=A0ABU9DA42_9PROT
MQGKSSAGPLAALALLSLIWGYNWIFMKDALEYSPPFLFAGLRATVGAGVLLAISPLLGVSLRPPPWRQMLPLGLVQTTGFVGFTVLALVYGGAGKTAILVYTMPVWLILLAWPLLHERVHGLQWPALGLVLGGIIVLLAPWSHHTGYANALFGLLSALCWAISAILLKQLGQDRQVNMMNLTAWQMLLGGMVLLLIAWAIEPMQIRWTPRFVLDLAYNALPANALAWLLWSYALQRLSAGIAGMSMLFTPLIGVFAAWAHLGEVPGRWEGLGMLSILIALALVSWQHWQGRERVPLAAAQE